MEASLDTWTIVFLFASVQGVFLSILLFLRKGKANQLLAWLIFSFSFCLLYYVAFWTRYEMYLPREVSTLQGLTMVFGPLTYSYLQTNNKQVYSVKWHLIPFGIYIVLHLLFLQHPDYSSFRVFLPVIQVTHLLIYTYLIFQWLSVNKATTNGALKRYLWRKKVAWIFAGYSFSFLLYYVLVWTKTIQVEYDYMISAVASFFIYFIGYHGFQHPEWLRADDVKKYPNSSLPSNAAHNILDKTKDILKEEKLYLDGSLKLTDVANRLQLSPHHVSQAINDIDGRTFTELINDYRVQTAKNLLLEPESKKMIHIAYDSGFNNKVSFNNVFRRFTGQSPGEYRKMHLVKEKLR